VSGFTDDRFLDGRVTIRQPTDGFRSGLDAVMLAAAVPPGEIGDVLELGAGAGAASLCLASRVSAYTVTGVDIDPALAALANGNARTNGMAARVRFVAADALHLPQEMKREYAHVFSNPPFHGDEGMAPPDESRRRAVRDEGSLSLWLAAGARRTVSGGTFTAILRADRLGETLAALPEKGLVIFPLWPKAGEPARRVILQLRKGSGAPLALSSGLVLHEADGRFTKDADAILRGGASLALG
jgi:tRNA1Val (adenine37-N6)-methyltransferase